MVISKIFGLSKLFSSSLTITKSFFLSILFGLVIVLLAYTYFPTTTLPSIKAVIDLESKPRKYIQYLCHGHCGGLGDRLKGLFSSYALSLLTKRAFLIQMTWPCPLERLFDPNQVNWLRSEAEHGRLNETTRAFLTLRAHYTQLKSEDLIKFAEINSSELLTIGSNAMFMNAFAENPYLKSRITELGYTPAKFKLQFVFYEWFKKLFKLKKETEAEFQAMRKAVKKDRPGHKLICAQYREGTKTQTNLFEPTIAGMGASKLFWRFINETFLNKDKLKGSNYTIYVTTDSNEAKQEAKDFFGADKVFTTSGEANFHIDRDFGEEARKVNELEQASICTGVSKIIIDFLLLGECDMAVATHSGFGLLGLWNRPEPGKDLYVYSTLDYIKKGIRTNKNLQFINISDLNEFYFGLD